MPSLVMATLAVLTMATFVPSAFAQSADAVPQCLNQCLQQTTQPCTTSSLPALINCINAKCPQDSDTDDTASSMSLTYTPKVQYSCQQSFVPGAGELTTPMELNGTGACMTSPYDFQSLFVSSPASASADESVTLQKMARQCTITLYAGEGCNGGETTLDLGDVQGDRCIFQGGRSARLMCSALRAPDRASYASILSSLCTATNANGNGTAPAANSTTSSSTYEGVNATSSATPPPPATTSAPYTGRASGDQVAKPSLVALMALFAVAVLLL